MRASDVAHQTASAGAVLGLLCTVGGLRAVVTLPDARRAWAKDWWNLAEAVIVAGSVATLFSPKGDTREVHPLAAPPRPPLPAACASEQEAG